MAKNKTTETELSVEAFLLAIKDADRQKDCRELVSLISEALNLTPKMWGTAIVGFGSYHYKYESGREGDAPLTGLASRASDIVFYLSSAFDQRDELLARLGKHKTGKGCVYIKKLSDIDKNILLEMIKHSASYYSNKYN